MFSILHLTFCVLGTDGGLEDRILLIELQPINTQVSQYRSVETV